MWLVTQIASALCWILYGSFFEWYWHKFFMHTPRFPMEAFRGHTIVHHGIYKGDDRYFLQEGEHPEHILLKPYALPALVATHLPVMWLIERYLVANTIIGGVAAALLYFVIYEYMHWNMHVPRGHFVERFRWFRFLRRHHHLHHQYFQSNFCVLFPLADWVMGTLLTDESLARRRREREEAIARGEQPERREKKAKRVRLGRSKISSGLKANFQEKYRYASERADTRLKKQSALARQFDKFKSRRRRVKPRRDWNLKQLKQVREALHLGKDRRD